MSCSTGSLGPIEEIPWEGDWRLVRMNGAPLPFRRDSIEVVFEQVQFFDNGAGFARDSMRVYAGSTGTMRGCNAWMGVVVNETVITTTRTQQAPVGTCLPNAELRTYRLDGDTLRLSSGAGVQLNDVSRAYVRR